MTRRTVFEPKSGKPYYQKIPVEFDFHPGLSPLQKKKNVKAMHEAYAAAFPGKKVLEVSTKSESPLGQSLSPFNLERTLPTLEKAFPVENIFQASKCYDAKGPYYDLLGTSPLEAKQDPRVQGKASHYKLEGQEYPASPDVLYYNWLYAMAVLENNKGRDLLDWDAFTDVEFPAEDGNCQARACAVTKSLLLQQKLKKNMSFQEFSDLFLESPLPQTDVVPAMKYKEAPRILPRTAFSVGDVLNHPTIGQGTVVKKTPRDYTVLFRVSGPKTLRKDIVETRCKKV